LESCPTRPSNQAQPSNFNMWDRHEPFYKLSSSLESCPTQLSNENQPSSGSWSTKLFSLECSPIQPSNEDQPPSESWSGKLLSSLESSSNSLESSSNQSLESSLNSLESSSNQLPKECEPSTGSPSWLLYSLESSLKQLSRRAFLAPGPRRSRALGPGPNFCWGPILWS